MVTSQEELPLEAPDDQQEDETEIKEENVLLRGKDVLTWSTDWTAFTVVDQMKRGTIDLHPSFQRRQAWDIPKRSDLIISLLENIPIPQIVLAETPNERGTYIVIDGKQRLMALAQFLGGEDFAPFKLKTHIKELNGKSYSELDRHHRNIVDNSVIRTVILRNTDNDFLYSVFLKLNMGSSKLSPQELRQALVPGDFTTFVDDFGISSPGIKLLMGLSSPDPRMRDTELALRYFSFINNISKYRGNLKNFLDYFSQYLNENWNTNCELIYRQAEEFEKTVGQPPI